MAESGFRARQSGATVVAQNHRAVTVSWLSAASGMEQCSLNGEYCHFRDGDREPKVGTGSAQVHSAYQQQSWDENPGLLPLCLSVSGPKMGRKPAPKLSRATSFLNMPCVLWGSGRGTDQKRWPHRLMTASLAVSRQMLHSKVLSCPPLSPAPLLLPLGPPALEFSGDAEAEGPLLAILGCQQALSEDSPQGNPERQRAHDCPFLQATPLSLHANTPIFSQVWKFRL